MGAFSERALHSKQIHVLSLHSGSRWFEWLLNEYLPLLSLLSAYKHVRPLKVYIYKTHSDTYYNTSYSELEAVLDQVRIDIQPYRQTPDIEYTALPSWSTLQGANARAIAPQLRRAVRYVQQLAESTYTTTEDDEEHESLMTLRLQVDARPMEPELRKAIRRFDVDDTSTQMVLLPKHTLLSRVGYLTRAMRTIFLPGSEACMALFVKPDAHLVDIRRVRHKPVASSADRTPQAYARWVADTDDTSSTTAASPTS